MWSAWLEPNCIYLSSGRVLVRSAGCATVALEMPGTLPLDRILGEIAPHLRAGSRARQGWSVHLSAAICPALTVTPPEGVRGFNELLAYAKAAASAQLGLGVADVQADFDMASPGIVAAVPGHLFDALSTWASAVGIRLTSIRPLWSVATDCALARRHRVNGILLREPDSLTVVAPAAPGHHDLALTVALDSASTETATQRQRMLASAAPRQLLAMDFGVQSGSVVRGLPRLWPAHWRLA